MQIERPFAIRRRQRHRDPEERKGVRLGLRRGGIPRRFRGGQRFHQTTTRQKQRVRITVLSSHISEDLCSRLTVVTRVLFRSCYCDVAFQKTHDCTRVSSSPVADWRPQQVD